MKIYRLLLLMRRPAFSFAGGLLFIFFVIGFWTNLLVRLYVLLNRLSAHWPRAASLNHSLLPAVILTGIGATLLVALAHWCFLRFGRKKFVYGGLCFALLMVVGFQTHTFPALDTNNVFTGTNIFSGNLLAKNFANIPHCEQYATAGVTPFQTVMASCVAAITSTGPRIVDATNLSDSTNLTMTGNWAIASPNGLTVLFGDYVINQGTNSITCAAPCNNLAFKGSGGPYVTTSAGVTNGPIFKYTGSGVAHDFGDATGGTSFGHLFEDIGFDMTSATGSAIAIRTTRAYGERFSRVRGLCPVAANTMTFIQSNGGTGAPGSQSSTYEDNVENNCQFGVVVTASFTVPPGCNDQRFGVNQFSGNSAAGSIAIDIECGNAILLEGPYIGGYDTGLKVASPSAAAVWGWIHMESCVTNGILFTAVANNNVIWSDTSCTINDANGSSTSNSVFNGSVGNFVFSNDLQNVRWRNVADVPINFTLSSGNSAAQQVNFTLSDRGTAKWVIQKDTANELKLQKSSSGINRLQTSGNNTIINSESTAAVQINGQGAASTGTGGLQILNGGASPAIVASIDGSGGFDNSQLANAYFRIRDVGQCTMAAGTCTAQSLSHTYTTAPTCFLTWTGTGALAGQPKVASTTTTVTPSSSNGADTAQVNWECHGK